MATAWVLTIPAAGVMCGIAWEVSRIFGKSSAAGSIVIGVLAAVVATLIFQLAQPPWSCPPRRAPKKRQCARR